MKDCNQCGKCCENYSNGRLSALASEIAYWEVFRPDIFRYVSKGNIWMDPDTNEQLRRCPWLRYLPVENQYTCDIYHDRPDDCKYYPVTINQMLEDECEMLEVNDLSDPKRGQQALDKLMLASRPSIDISSF